jgi:uncharacterized protein (TIGR02147 family)
MKHPNIYEFLDLRLYLFEIYQCRKLKESDFSYEKWAQEMGFRSRSYLRSIVIGEKPMHESLLVPLTKSLSLDVQQTDYLTLLLRYSIAPTTSLKESYGRQLIREWKAQIQKVEIADIVEFLSDSLIPVVFTYLSFKDVSSNLNVMCRFLNCEADRLQNCLRVLIWQKLVDGTIDDQGQIQYKTIQPYFKIPSLPGNPILKTFHQEGLRLANHAMERPASERKFYATFVAMSDDQFQKFQELIQDFNQRLLAICDSPDLQEKKIYRFNAQIFPA